ncbi:MAG TPA: hypothetical protein VFI52_03090 [Gemmatimonadaceae bacterium]|nr:hypothetical protein [Gemmatimonadaceae bacterium]
MPYTVWSRGRQIGETDLGFYRLIDQSRSGWFHPNAEGERVMPVIASVLPAMRAYLHRDKVDAAGDPMVQPALYGSTLFADLAEAFQHMESLDLELRREDGSVVPTSCIGIQDTHQLLPFPEELLAEDATTGDADVEFLEFIDELEREFPPMSDAEAVEEVLESLDDPMGDWTPDELDESRFPRYQIHIELMHGDAIP